ncbi:MAG: response regulator transcription factor [Planctomycetes bacterium]|nr:response regulator transcription factor [Planctomycetota bacterium]
MIDQDSVVWVVEDDESMRESLVTTLASTRTDVRSFESGRDFLEAFDPGRPGCVVLDMRMPGVSGLEVHKVLVERGAEVPVVFVTGYADVAVAVEAMRHGAFDFVEKPFEADDILERVEAALHHGRREFQRVRRRNVARQRIEMLTAREREVLEFVAGGLSNKEIAESLGISRRTVEVHRNHLMTKMGTGNVVELVTMFRDAAEGV